MLDAPLTVDDHGTLARVAPGPLQLEHVRLPLSRPGARRRLRERVAAPASPGSTLGLVGPTGAGKSTLLRLLLRHHAPDSRHDHLERLPLRDYTLDALRARDRLGAAGSLPVLGHRRREHRAGPAGRHAAQQIEQAARLAAIHDDILRLPQGYDTPVGERGVTLSGGQRQRVAIARALLADAPLLLLDDALSAVDTGTEARILAPPAPGARRPHGRSSPATA